MKKETEFEAMQRKAGLPPVEKSTNEKQQLDESMGGVVGVGAINNIFPEREPTEYENAFEHFLSEQFEAPVDETCSTEIEETESVEEDAADGVTITVSIEPLQMTFNRGDIPEDFEGTNMSFDSFKQKLLSDESFAYDTFWDNMSGEDISSALDKQNQDNWKINVN